MPPEWMGLIADWRGAVVVGLVWGLRELYRWRAQKADLNSQFATLMLQREQDLVSRVNRLEEEVIRLRLILAKNNIDPSGDSYVE